MFSKEQRANIYFIIAPGRSGSSLLQELFNCFQGFNNLGESRHLDGSKRSCHLFIRKGKNFRPLKAYIESKWKAKYFIEKTPDSIMNIDLLAERCPESNFIFLERNPLKIVLSHLNKHQRENLPSVKKAQEKSGQTFEVYHTQRILEMIEAQVKNKPLCLNQMTVRYEDLVQDYQATLLKIGAQFNLVTNIGKAEKVMSRPAYSSKDNSYEIKDLKEPEAIALVNKACRLWGYPEVG